MPKGPFYFHPLRALCSVYTRSLSTTAYRKSSHKWRGETVCVYRWAWPYKELLLKNRLAQLVLAEAGSFPTTPIDGFASRQRTSVVDWITNNSPSSIDVRRTPTLSAGPFILSWFLNGAQASQSQDLFRVRSFRISYEVGKKQSFELYWIPIPRFKVKAPSNASIIFYTNDSS